MPRSLVVGWALRAVAIAVATAAVVAVVQQGSGAAPRFERPAAVAPAGSAANGLAAPPSRRTWSLRLGGWFIRVDGAEVPIPSVAELTKGVQASASSATALTPFDPLIAQHAHASGFDWRLVAALIFEESRFDPTSRSDKGAYGLMQVRPIAAEDVGATRFHAPDDNVETGVRYLKRLNAMFAAAARSDRLALVLAAYNAGPGHVRDAQELARRFGYAADRWDGAVERVLPLLEEPSVYNSLPNGFAKGRQIVAYVHRILDRYQRYTFQSAADGLGASDAGDASADTADN